MASFLKLQYDTGKFDPITNDGLNVAFFTAYSPRRMALCRYFLRRYYFNVLVLRNPGVDRGDFNRLVFLFFQKPCPRDPGTGRAYYQSLCA